MGWKRAPHNSGISPICAQSIWQGRILERGRSLESGFVAAGRALACGKDRSGLWYGERGIAKRCGGSWQP
ncbi:MAG: hypothetical protein HFH40_04975 [Lachnospiraceae bacterium]|nr:hypothetical protein [Lachnospiraceae bacterium]